MNHSEISETPNDQSTSHQTSSSYSYNRPIVSVRMRHNEPSMLTLRIENLTPCYIANLDGSFIDDECFGFKLLLRDGCCQTMDSDTVEKILSRHRCGVAYSFLPDHISGTYKEPTTTILVNFDACWPKNNPKKLSNLESEFTKQMIFFANYLESVLVARYKQAKAEGATPDYFSLGEVKNSGGKIYDQPPAETFGPNKAEASTS